MYLDLNIHFWNLNKRNTPVCVLRLKYMHGHYQIVLISYYYQIGKQHKNASK